jgi:hypothetical protein
MENQALKSSTRMAVFNRISTGDLHASGAIFASVINRKRSLETLGGETGGKIQRAKTQTVAPRRGEPEDLIVEFYAR